MIGLTRSANPADERGMSNSPFNMQRLVAALVLTVAFLIVAAVITPGQTEGHDLVDHGEHHHDQPQDTHANGHHLGSSSTSDAFTTVETSDVALGTIEGVFHCADVLSTLDGPRFTIRDTSTNRIIAECLTDHEVRQSFPDIPLNTHDGGETTLMMHLDRIGSPAHR